MVLTMNEATSSCAMVSAESGPLADKVAKWSAMN